MEEAVARAEARPEPDGYADLSPGVRALFGLDNPDAFQSDERGDGIGDDEASQLRWQSANPRQVRARRPRL